MSVTLSDCPYCKAPSALYSLGDKQWDESSCEFQIGMNSTNIFVCVKCEARVKQISTNTYIRLKTKPLPQWLVRKLNSK